MPQHYPNRLRRMFVAVLFTAALLTGARGAYAQETPPDEEPTPTPAAAPSPESEELRRLRERNAILEEQKKIAVNEKDIDAANKARLESQFPKPTATPLAGTTTVDAGVKIESEMAAYASMSKAADLISKELKGKVTIKSLAVYNNRDIKTLLGYTVVDTQIDLMKGEYGKQFAPAPAAPAPAGFRGSAGAFLVNPVTIATSVLGSFIDLIALLRTDTTVTGMTFNVAESALVSEVFRALKRDAPGGYGNGINLFYPAVFPPNISADREYEILKKIQELYLLKDRSGNLTARIGETEKLLGETAAEIAGLKKSLQQIAGDLPSLDKELERLQKLYWRWPSARLAERIEETHGRIEKLKDDKVKATAALAAKTALKGTLEHKLEQLYGELAPTAQAMIPAAVTIAAIGQAEQQVVKAEGILGRKFSSQEMTWLLRGFSEVEKKQLVEAAEKHHKAKLADADKATLTEPLTDAERSALGSVAQAQAATPGTPLTVAQKEAALTAAQKLALAPDEEKAAVRSRREQVVGRLKALNGQFDKLVGELIKVDEAAGVNALTSYLQAENLNYALCGNATCKEGTADGSFWMQLRVVSAGGNNKVKRNLITSIFTGDDISHSGGSIVEYILYDLKGNARHSNTLTVYEDYRKARDIKSLAGENH